MATPDWTTVPDTSLEPGDPIRSIDIIAINNHTAAMAGGAAGAPEIKLMAIEMLSAGDVIRSRYDTEVAGDAAVAPHSFRFMQIGTIRATVQHKASNALWPSTVKIVRVRNDISTTIAEWSTTSLTYVSRSADLSVLPGDLVQITKSGGDPTFPTYMRNARFQTAGENMWPGNQARLENDYTVV